MMFDSEDSRDDASELEARLDAAVWSVASEPVPAEGIARVKARANALQLSSKKEFRAHASLPSLVSLTSATHKLDQTCLRMSRVPFLSRSFIVKCVSVATVAAVVAAFLFMQSSPNSAYGQVIKQLREARSFSYLKRMESEGRPNPIEVKILVADDGRQRHEQSGGTVMIMDPSPQIRLTLIDRTKTAIVSEPHTFPQGRVAKHPLEWLEVLMSHGDKPDKQLGTKMLDGRQVDGFVTMQGQTTYTIWIDSQTKELVRVEHDMPVKGLQATKVVMSDFRFSEKLDDSLFSFDVPKGFKTINSKALDRPQAISGEASIIEALRGFTQKSAGKFPKSLTDLSDFVTLMSKGSKDGQIDQESRKTMSHLSNVLPFLSSLPKSDYEYVGAGKTMDDNRCIVFWYRDKNKNMRAIYNDLSASSFLEIK